MKEYICLEELNESLSNRKDKEPLLSDIGYGLSLAESYANDLTRLTKVDICKEFALWLAGLSRDKSDPMIERNANRWIEDFMAEMEKGE